MLEKFRNSAVLKTLALAAALFLCQPGFAVDSDLHEPTGVEMAADLIIGRPISLLATAAGSVVWLLGLPFSALGGNVEQSAEVLIVEPARATFVRCLGCNEGDYIR